MDNSEFPHFVNLLSRSNPTLGRPAYNRFLRPALAVSVGGGGAGGHQDRIMPLLAVHEAHAGLNPEAIRTWMVDYALHPDLPLTPGRANTALYLFGYITQAMASHAS